MRNGSQVRSLLGQSNSLLIQPTNKFGEKLKEQVEKKLTNLGK